MPWSVSNPDMTTTFLLFIPFLILVVLANLGQTRRWARWLTYLSLLLMALLVLTAGAIILLGAASDLAANLPAAWSLDQPTLGWRLLLTGLLTVIVIVSAFVATISGRDPRLRSFAWSQPVQLTAIVFVILLIGGNLAVASLLSDPTVLGGIGVTSGLGLVVGQGIALVALACLGVGLGTRRTWGVALGTSGASLYPVWSRSPPPSAPRWR